MPCFYIALLLFFRVSTVLAEPEVQEVVAQALRHANVPEGISSSLKERVRKAAWLPQFKTRVIGDIDFGQSVREKVGDAPVRMARDLSGLAVEIEARWELSKLVYNPDEIEVAKEHSRIVAQRERLSNAVTELFFARQLLLQENKIETDKHQKLLNGLKIAELQAKLDTLTGGWLTAQLEARP